MEKLNQLVSILEEDVLAVQSEVTSKFGNTMNVKPARIVLNMHMSIQEIRQFLKEQQ